MNDHRSAPLAIGDRVIPVHWGEIPLWLCGTPATIVGFGRKRVQIRFDIYSYEMPADPADRAKGAKEFHSISPASLRKTTL